MLTSRDRLKAAASRAHLPNLFKKERVRKRERKREREKKREKERKRERERERERIRAEGRERRGWERQELRSTFSKTVRPAQRCNPWTAIGKAARPLTIPAHCTLSLRPLTTPSHYTRMPPLPPVRSGLAAARDNSRGRHRRRPPGVSLSGEYCFSMYFRIKPCFLKYLENTNRAYLLNPASSFVFN